MKPLWIFVPFFILFSCSLEIETGELIPDSIPYDKDIGTDYLEFLVYGDAGKGTTTQNLTADEMASYVSDTENSTDFIINLGDNFYEYGVESVTDPLWNSNFEEMYDPSVLNMPFYSILGNHDYRGNIGAQIDYVSPNNDRWQMPARYYRIETVSLDDGTQIDFFFLDTERIFYGDAEQITWFKNAISESNAKWKIVSGHRPMYSYGNHGYNAALIMRLQPLIDNNTDLYLAGHEHDMQIIGPVNGVYHFVNGSAGSARSTSIGEMTILAAARAGFMYFLISPTQLVCRVIETGSGVIYTEILKEKP